MHLLNSSSGASKFMFYKILVCLISIIIVGCKSDVTSHRTTDNDDNGETNNEEEIEDFKCVAEEESYDYDIYVLAPNNVPIGDVMPYYDKTGDKYYVYYLKDLWDDSSNELHPIYGFKTDNFYNYSELNAGEIVGSSDDTCDQDYAIGTGSFYEKDGKYYSFYTGHNPNHPSECTETKEGVMMATSHSLNESFDKDNDFETVYAPSNKPFDHEDNFRDPFVYYDKELDKYAFIISSRKNYKGEWQGVIARFVSEDLMEWEYKDILYDGGDDNFFMMETPELFKMGDTYYLLFSDTGTRHVYYRKSSSSGGPWQEPSDKERFSGVGIYAARTASDGNNRYIAGWTLIKEGHNDHGNPLWGGNLIAHEIYQKDNKDLAVKAPDEVLINMRENEYETEVFRKYGDGEDVDENESYRLKHDEEEFSSLIKNPVEKNRYKISASVNFSDSDKDFGFLFGACDENNDFFSLRFVPDENRVGFTKKLRQQIDENKDMYNDVPFEFESDRDYEINIVLENSMLVVYIDDKIALSSRVYRALGNHWGIYSDQSEVLFENLKVTYP